MHTLLKFTTICLALFTMWLAPDCVQAAPVSPEGLELSGFQVKAPANPAIGDKVVVEFTLRNVGQSTIRFDSKAGAFVGTRRRSKSGGKALNRDFGFCYLGWKLEPGQSISINVYKILDMKGQWSFFPTYLANGKWGPWDTLKKTLDVSSRAAPLAGDKRFSPDAGKSVVIYKGKRLPIQLLPPDNPWNQDISKLPVHPNSQAWLANIGIHTKLRADFGSGRRFVVFGHALKKGRPHGIPFIVIREGVPQIPVDIKWKSESEPGPYYIPQDAPIEGETGTGAPNKSDAHIIALHYDRMKLYELYKTERRSPGFAALQGTVWDLTSNKLRPLGWTSADAAGLPIFPGLVRYEEVYLLKEIRHALRFTVKKSGRAFILPATHWASTIKHPSRPPMGMRVRLKADFDIEPFPEPVQVILRCLKKYGMILADNGGDLFISGAPHPDWDDDALEHIKKIKGKDLEVVYTGETITSIPKRYIQKKSPYDKPKTSKYHINNPAKKKKP